MKKILLLIGIVGLLIGCGPSKEEQEAAEKAHQDSIVSTDGGEAPKGSVMRYHAGQEIQMKPGKVDGIVCGFRESQYIIDYFDKNGEQHTCFEYDFELE